MMMEPQIRDQFIPLCNLVCEESYDGVLRQSAALLCGFFDARDSVLLLLDSLGQNLVVTLGARRGDANWVPDKISLGIEEDRRNNGPFAQVALTGKSVAVSSPNDGYDTAFIEGILGTGYGHAVILPLLRPDRGLLGAALVAGANTDKLSLKDTQDTLLFASALGGVLFQKITEGKRLRERKELRRSLVHIDKNRDELRDKLLLNLQEKLPGRSKFVQKLHRQISQLANFEGNITIFGPDGSGKDRVARELHRASRWARSPFVFVNCRDLNLDNFASLVYGHKRGAISGIAAARKGYLREAGEGMVFFDRVDLLPLDLQRELARLLERKTYRTQGSERENPVSARLVFSAAADLPSARGDDRFMATLFFRMTQSTIHLLPLSARREDIPDIATSFLSQLNRNQREPRVLSEEAMLLLTQEQTGGDVRELESRLERAFLRIIDGERQLLPEHFVEKTTDPTTGQNTEHNAASLPDRMAIFERSLLLAALKETGFDRALAAEYLKIPKRTLADKCKKYQI